ncbi:MAG: hypothetical protein AB8F95_19095 [Bacteroidia bacterium]
MKRLFLIRSARFWKISLCTALVLLIAGTAIYVSRYPSIVRCMTIAFQDFDKLDQKVYVSPGTPPETQNLLRELIKRSEVRVADLWGGYAAEPVLIYCHDNSCFDRFGAGSPGVAYLTPLGPYVVIGPRGLRTDVLSHELCHAELFTRIGWWNSEFEKPAWFDEGLAMQLDHRYAKRGHSRFFGFMIDWERRVGKDNEAFALHKLRDRSAFTSGDFRQTELAYVTSGMEVSRWLEAVGHMGLLRFTDRLCSGESFEKAYAEIEKGAALEEKWLSN